MTAHRASSHGQAVRSVQLNDSELAAVLDRIDAHVASNPKSANQEDCRFSYRLKDVTVTLFQPGGTAQSFLAPTRDISVSGVSFLHGAYVHQNTRCRLSLVTTIRTYRVVEGVVLRCTHVEGRIHELGVVFDQRIDVSAFASEAVKCRVLIVDDDSSISRLGSFYLGQLNADTQIVNGGRAALEATAESIFDVVLMDLDMPDTDGFQTLTALHQSGYTGRVVAVTARTSDAARERCLAAGFYSFMKKPFTKDSLGQLLGGVAEEPLYSSLAEEPGMAELIVQFVEGLGAKIRAISTASAQHDLENLGRLVRSLKGESGSYGYGPIADVAEKLEALADSSAATEEMGKLMVELQALCRAARAPGDSRRAR